MSDMDELKIKIAKMEDDIKTMKEILQTLTQVVINHINGDYTYKDIMTCAKVLNELEKTLGSRRSYTPMQSRGDSVDISTLIEVARQFGVGLKQQPQNQDNTLQIDEDLKKKLREMQNDNSKPKS